MGVVQETVEDGGGNDRVAEHAPQSANPLLEVRMMLPRRSPGSGSEAVGAATGGRDGAGWR